MLEIKKDKLKNKKLFISLNYLRKVFRPKNSPNNIFSINSDSDSNFIKTPNIQTINRLNEQRLLSFQKHYFYESYKLEKEMKSNLIESEEGLKNRTQNKRLLKSFSYHINDQNQSKKLSKNLFHSPNNSNKKFINNLLNTKTNSNEIVKNKRKSQKDYSNYNRKLNNRPKTTTAKENKKILFNGIKVNDTNKKNIIIQNLKKKRYTYKTI